MLKKLFSYLKYYKKETILAIIFVVLETLLEIVVPFLMNFILQNNLGIFYGSNQVITKVNYVVVYSVGGAMIGCALLAFLFGILGARYTAICGRGLGATLRDEEYKAIQKYSFNNLDNFRASSLITRLTNDITIIQDSFCQSFRASLRSPVLLIFSLVLAFIVSPYLGLIFLVAIPVLAIILGILLKLVTPKFKALQKIVDRLNRTTQESIIAIRTIKAYVKEDYEQLKFNEVNEDLRKTASSSFSLIAMNMPTMQFVTYSTIIALLVFGASFFTQGLIQDVSEISTFLSYIMQLLATMQMLSNVFMMINRSSASVTRVLEVIDTKSEIIDNVNSTSRINSGSIRFDHVSFKYNKNAKEYVLKDINFNIKHGQYIGIIGQTGSSKTTLVNLIERFYDTTEGEIYIDNQNIKDFSLKELHDKIAISFQGPLLFSGTILDNLKWGNKNASMEEIIEACKITCSYDFIMNQLPNGFETIIGQTGSNVSGGQRQRLCLARALLKKPKILILDDSFSALDRITEAQIKENLKSLKDITKIVISQKVSAIEDADEIIVLNEGKIENIGTHDELLIKDEIYQNTYKIQNEGKLE